ncbi:hypothetical protein EON79_10245 [bacterium]|nr:MAG: hypothetical protein EON79_10245 [bacterium]
MNLRKIFSGRKDGPKKPTPKQWAEIQERMHKAMLEWNDKPPSERERGEEGVMAHLRAAAVWEMSGYGQFAVTDSTSTSGVFSLTDIETGFAIGSDFERIDIGPQIVLGQLSQFMTPDEVDEMRRQALQSRLQEAR